MGKLTLKQKSFVKDYLQTGNASLAVQKNYNVKDNATARTIGSENLTKPNIKESIQEALETQGLTDTHLASKVAELVNAKKRITVLHKGEVEMIKEEIDTYAVKSGLEFAFKLKNLGRGGIEMPEFIFDDE